MSIEGIVFLHCDGPNEGVPPKSCPYWEGAFIYVPDRTDTAKRQREEARRDGWVRVKNKDYCRKCAEILKLKE